MPIRHVWPGVTPVSSNETSWRTDPRLIVMLDETAEWAVRGVCGAVLGQAASLRAAMTMARDLEDQVVALTQAPDDHVIVFHDQMDRLAEARAD